MKWLAEHCHVLPVREGLRALEGGDPLRRPLVAVTFDDGYADNYDLAAPILEEYGLRGTFFITSGFVEQGQPLWYDRAADAWQRASDAARNVLLERLHGHIGSMPLGKKMIAGVQTWMAGLKNVLPEQRFGLLHQAEAGNNEAIDPERYRAMTPLQVIDLHRRGHEIACHTVTHPILPQLDDDNLRSELTHSARCLEAWIGEQPVGFCYPNGDFDGRVERAVVEAGYQYGCLMQTGLNRPGVQKTRLARLAITMQRTVTGIPKKDSLGFRAELCRFREWWR
jgi:peptidoglycan/xylan/chitin deacetylase (PgdA/CDA1 family)